MVLDQGRDEFFGFQPLNASPGLLLAAMHVRCRLTDVALLKGVSGQLQWWHQQGHL